MKTQLSSSLSTPSKAFTDVPIFFSVLHQHLPCFNTKWTEYCREFQYRWYFSYRRFREAAPAEPRGSSSAAQGQRSEAQLCQVLILPRFCRVFGPSNQCTRGAHCWHKGREALPPKNINKLHSFLGLMNYYRKFIWNLATLLHPLHLLLHQGTCWTWTRECQHAFEEAKSRLVTAPVLTSYDPKLPIVLAADASNYGIGAVISYQMQDGYKKPIAFISRTLSTTERNYAQVKNEELSLISGVRKFHQFLFGRPFILVTDHKPLLQFYGP